MVDPRFVACLVKWLSDREPRLGGRVAPSFERPGAADPYLTYTLFAPIRVANKERRTGQTSVRVQLDVWSQDHALATSISANIAGTGTEAEGSRGLDQHVGTWPHPDGTTPGVVVQFAELVDDSGGDEADAPILGTETPWFVVGSDYRIHYEEIT